MVSRTKYKIDESSILHLFEENGIHGITNASSLGDGEFNAVFLAESPKKKYVLKIAPPEELSVMSYEIDMMRSEVFWYGIMREQANIRVPEVYAADFSKKHLPVPYFIMEYLPGEPLNQAHLSKAKRKAANAALSEMTARMHAVSGARFGYEQCGLYDTWYDAIRSMISQTIGDCTRKKRRSPRGERLLKLVERHKAALESAKCCMVNFDIWPANIICQLENGALRLAWIDPERSFWGDPMLDFVCFAFHKPLSAISDVIAVYNATAKQTITCTPEETIRFAVGQGYLSLIMETEKYYRYTPLQYGWWRNVIACRLLYRAAFRALK